jgi:hypothetical protein
VEDHKWTLRKVLPPTVRALMRSIASHLQGAKWETICAEAISSGDFAESISNARKWHYSSVLRCLGLTSTPRPGWYVISEAGLRFVNVIGSGESFTKEEVQVLRNVLLRCGPVRHFCAFLMGTDDVHSLLEVETKAKPVFCEFQRGFGVLHNSFGDTETLESRTVVNQWQDGILDLCKSLHVVDELRLPDTIVEGFPSNHVVFPIGSYDHDFLTSEWLDATIKSDPALLASGSRLYIPQLIFHLATHYRIGVQELHDALNKYVLANRSTVYLDRVSALTVRTFESCFLEVDGVWRSSMVYDRQK